MKPPGPGGFGVMKKTFSRKQILVVYYYTTPLEQIKTIFHFEFLMWSCDV